MNDDDKHNFSGLRNGLIKIYSPADGYKSVY